MSTCMYVYNDNRLPEEGSEAKCRNILHGFWGFLAELSNRFAFVVGCDVCIGKHLRKVSQEVSASNFNPEDANSRVVRNLVYK